MTRVRKYFQTRSSLWTTSCRTTSSSSLPQRRRRSWNALNFKRIRSRPYHFKSLIWKILTTLWRNGSKSCKFKMVWTNRSSSSTRTKFSSCSWRARKYMRKSYCSSTPRLPTSWRKRRSASCPIFPSPTTRASTSSRIKTRCGSATWGSTSKDSKLTRASKNYWTFKDRISKWSKSLSSIKRNLSIKLLKCVNCNNNWRMIAGS